MKRIEKNLELCKRLASEKINKEIAEIQELLNNLGKIVELSRRDIAEFEDNKPGANIFCDEPSVFLAREEERLYIMEHVGVLVERWLKRNNC